MFPFACGGFGSSFSSLDPAHKSSAVTLSGNNYIATANTLDQPGAVRGTISRNSRKLYFECTIIATDFSGANSVGVCNPGFTFATVVGADIHSWGFLTGGAGGAFFNGSSGPHTNPSLGVNPGDVIMVAVDFDGGQMFFGANGTWLNGTSPAGSPDFTFTVNETLFPALSVDNLSDELGGAVGSFSFNPGSSNFSFGPPSGYSAWG